MTKDTLTDDHEYGHLPASDAKPERVADARTPAGVHLPRRRHDSPWSSRAVFLIAVVAALALAPLWLNPGPLELPPDVSATPSPAGSAQPTPSAAIAE